MLTTTNSIGAREIAATKKTICVSISAFVSTSTTMLRDGDMKMSTGCRMSIEFKRGPLDVHKRRTYEAVEVGADFRVVFEDKHGRRKTVSNGRVAFEIISRGRLYDQLLLDYELKQRAKLKPVTTVSTVPLRETPQETVVEPVKTASGKFTLSDRGQAQVVADVTPTIQVIDEVAEAEQFIEAVEPWIPDPNDWYEARLKFAMVDKQFLVAELENLEEVWIPERDITRRPAHSLCLPVSTSLLVRLEPNVANHRFRYRGLECQIDGEPTETHATGEITHWCGTFGGARMSCGCNIFVMAPSRYDQLELDTGDKVAFEIKLSDKNKKYIGVNTRQREKK
jgi:hypothetical protein